MFHMLSAFDLAPGRTEREFAEAWQALADDLIAADLIVSVSALAARRATSPLDTDDGRTQSYFTAMNFRDQAQSDAAYARIDAQTQPTARVHARVLAMVKDPVFTCWEDLPTADQGA